MTTGTTHDRDQQTDGPCVEDAAARIRASDAERTAAVQMLKDAVAHGRLTPDEGSDRMATAFAARFRDELPAITADLPAPAAPVAATSLGWARLASALVAQLRHEVHATRAAGVQSRRFLVSALVAVLLLGVLVTLGGLAAHGLFDGGGFQGGPGR